MELLARLGLFSRTVENRFVFSLFDLLLCGVIVLVILRGWRVQRRILPFRNQLLLLMAFCFLGSAFAVEAAVSGFFLFFHTRLPELLFGALFHALQAGAWLLLAAGAYLRTAGALSNPAIFRGTPPSLPVLLAPVWLQIAAPVAGAHAKLSMALDWMNALLLLLVWVLFHRRPLGGRNLATAATAFLFVAALLHIGSSSALGGTPSVAIWNLEQFMWSVSLFVFALAIGEASHDLFDKVFVRLQVVFIVLASLMILVIVQTEKTEYLASIRGRSDQLAEFVRAHVDYFRQQNQPLDAALDREDFLQRIIVGFGNLPELKIIRIAAEGRAATYLIGDDGRVHRELQAVPSLHALPYLDADEYFLIQALPLKWAEPGQVEFYGTREFLDRHIRKRIVVIFSLFTGMVGLSTLMVGLVVRGASATIRQQAREIEEAERQLIHSSKLAAVGELAAGVAHEINNPATTILSRASLLLSEDGSNLTASDREDVQAILTQAQRIAQITGGLLTFSRPQALEIRPARIDGVISASLRAVDDRLTAHHIVVEKNLALDLPRVLADANSLARGLENLFRNAIDSMPEGGTLRVRAAREDATSPRLGLEISDTGSGIEGGNLLRIFDPFFTTKEVGKGTGLGLSILHGIIKEHHGTITVESQPGKGTKFTITLPTEE